MNSEKNKNLLIDLHYLPCLDYFTLLMEADKIILEAHEHFSKQTYRNRCYILGANGQLPLTIPVVKGSQKTKMRDVQIDFSMNWNKVHWQSIQSAYGKSAYFIHFADYLAPLYEQPSKYLWEWNRSLLLLCLKFLGINKEILESEDYHQTVDSVMDKRNLIHPKKASLFAHASYYQLFGGEFQNNLSILDLLFNEGRGGMSSLAQS